MSTSMRAQRVRGSLLVLAGAVGYGVLSTFVKLAYARGFSPAEVVGSQMVFGLMILCFLSGISFFFFSGTQWTGSLKTWLTTAAYGSCTGLVSIFYYLSVSYLPASVAVLLLMQFTWMSMVYEWVKEKRLPGAREILILLLILTGTFLASGVLGAGAHAPVLPGVLCGLLAAFFYTVFLIVNKNLGVGMGALQKSTLMVAGSCMPVFILFPPAFLFNGALAGLWIWAVPLAVFGMVLPPLAYAAGMPLAGLGVAAVLSTAELPVAVGLSSTVLGEQVSWIQWLGVGIILAGIVYSHLWERGK